eukprot:GHVL01032484.1.p1 GENE.GHVL01032484.1~~GHVL01032484.1.p1  ORF type:complete len:158 (-),score=21.58 GHVL01032484.1:468-941(-)
MASLSSNATPEMTRSDIVKQRIATRFEPAQKDQRALLFGSRGNNQYSSNPVASHNVMEEQNDQYIAELQGKVSMLKDVALGISKEAEESNNILNSMSTQFDTVKDMLGGTMKKLGNMMRRNGGVHMWAMAAFVIFMFILMYFLYGSRSANAKTTYST